MECGAVGVEEATLEQEWGQGVSKSWNSHPEIGRSRGATPAPDLHVVAQVVLQPSFAPGGGHIAQ